MKILHLSSVVALLFVLNACGESTTENQARNNQESTQQNNSETPVALTQLAAEMFDKDENSTPMNIDQMNLDIGEDTPNTAFDYMLPNDNQ